MGNNFNKLDWKIDQLWSGCILTSIAHAIMVAHYPLISYEKSWDRFNFSIQDSEGIGGTVTFHDKYCIGAFRNDNSDRIGSKVFKNATAYIKNAPQEVIKLSEEETFQYLLVNIGGNVLPVITTAFWGNDNELYIEDSYSDFLRYGGELIETQAKDFHSVINVLVDDYEMSTKQVDLMKIIYARKIKKPDDKIILTKKEINMIGTDDQEGLSESLNSFREINIDWEK